MRTRLAVFCLFMSAAVARADTLNDILARMDAAAPILHALNADVAMDSFDKLLTDHTLEHGKFQMQRKKSDVRAIIAFEGKGSDQRTLSFKGKTVLMYYPVSNSYQVFDMGSNSQVLNQFLLLGFGSSGKELSASYSITDLGQEKVAGSPATKLQLIPKDARVQEKLAKIEIWIPDNEGYPVQQQFYEPSGNSRKITYSNIVLNPPLSGNLEFKLPSGAKKI